MKLNLKRSNYVTVIIQLSNTQFSYIELAEDPPTCGLELISFTISSPGWLAELQQTYTFACVASKFHALILHTVVVPGL